MDPRTDEKPLSTIWAAFLMASLIYGAVGWFVGQVMAKTRGQANPQEASRLVKERLSGP